MTTKKRSTDSHGRTFAPITPTQKRAARVRPNKLRDLEDMARDVRRFIDYTEKAPDWLTNVLVHTIETVARLTGYPAPEWSPEEGDQQTTKMLANIFNAVMLQDIDPTDSKTRVRLALWELLHNDDCPRDLFVACGEFTCEQSNVGAENIYHSDQVLALVLQSVPPDGLQGYTARADKGGDA